MEEGPELTSNQRNMDGTPEQISIQRNMEVAPEVTSNEEDPEHKLFRAAMQGKWETVVDIYSAANISVQAAKITRSEDTVLHVAVRDGKSAVVEQLVNAVHGDPCEILKQKDKKGNTPLHLAANLGMVEVCAAMARKCPSLVVDSRNELGETPLFLAAKNGKKSAFFALQDAIETNLKERDPKNLSYCRRNDGNTILHVAITAEHLGMCHTTARCNFSYKFGFRRTTGQQLRQTNT